MKFSRIICLIFLFFASSHAAFAQYDDDDYDDGYESGKRSAPKQERIKNRKSPSIKKMNKGQTSVKSEANKSTHLSQKEQKKLMKKKERDRRKKYEETRGELNNKVTVKGMKKSEKKSDKINEKKEGSYFKRLSYSLNPKYNANRRKTARQGKELQKRQDKYRDKNDSGSDYNKQRQRSDKKKRILLNPLKKR